MKKTVQNCQQCGSLLSAAKIRRHAHWCSEECDALFNARHWGDVKLAPSTSGAIAELVVSVDLLSKGYAVFRALSPSCTCDLAVLSGRALCRVEVRSGYKSRLSGEIMLPGNLKKQIAERSRFDVLAIVAKDQTILYVPPVGEWFDCRASVEDYDLPGDAVPMSVDAVQ